MIFVGRLIDRLGTRMGYAAEMVFWSLASMAHAAANSFVTFAAARAALASAYLIALLIIHLLSPQLEPARIAQA
jgi:MFS family permease